MNGPSFGGWITSAPEASLAAFAQSRLDFVVIDCQHSAIDEAGAAEAVARVPAAARGQRIFVRVSGRDPASIGRVVDAGADGVLIPSLDEPEQATAAVAACCYPPLGARSFGPFGAGLERDPRTLTGRVEVFAMIETAAGYENAAAICGTDGLGGVFVGPADLSLALGLHLEEAFRPGELDGHLERIAGACREAGVVAGIHSGSGGAARMLAAGYSFITVGDLTSLLATGVREELADVA